MAIDLDKTTQTISVDEEVKKHKKRALGNADNLMSERRRKANGRDLEGAVCRVRKNTDLVGNISMSFGKSVPGIMSRVDMSINVGILFFS